MSCFFFSLSRRWIIADQVLILYLDSSSNLMSELVFLHSSDIPGFKTLTGLISEAVRFNSFSFSSPRFSHPAHPYSHSFTSLHPTTFHHTSTLALVLVLVSLSIQWRRILHNFFPILFLLPRSLNSSTITFYPREREETRRNLLGSDRNGWTHNSRSSQRIPTLFLFLVQLEYFANSTSYLSTTQQARP